MDYSISSDPTIFEISSDEDSDSVPPPKDPNALAWLSEMFGNEDDGDDEVVVLSEVKVSTNKTLMNDDDDDECLILDGDPDKPVQICSDAATTISNGGSEEELSIVAEKGQLACRDYPHSRHLCATFPFSSTSHVKFCDMCHCYVCDIRAPCIHWGNGVSRGDHCHSTDKEDIWKRHRKSFKQMQTAQPPPLVKKLPEAVLPAGLHRLRPCSSTNSYSYSKPNIISNRNSQRSGPTVARNKLRHDISRSQGVPRSSNTTDNAIRRDRVGGGNLGPHYVPPHVNFKRVGSPMLGNSRLVPPGFSYDPSKHLSQLHKNYYRPVTHHGDIHGKGSEDFFDGIDTELNAYQNASQPNMGSGFIDSLPYLPPPVYSQPIPQTRESQNLYPLENSDVPNVPVPNLLNFELSWSNPSVAQSAEGSSQLVNAQPTLEPSATPQGCPGSIDPAPSTEFDLNWMQSLEPHEPDPVKDLLTPALSFDFDSEAMLLFDFENS